MTDTKRYTIDNKPEGEKESSDRLSSLLPRPNIVRIEVLDGNSRDRYLKSQTSDGNGTNVYSITNQMRKTTIGSIYNGARAKEKVFYGFLDPSDNSSFNLGAGWEDQSMGGDIGGAVKKVVGNISNTLNTVIDIGSSFNDIANRTLGLNNTATGASTMKEFKNITLQDFSVKCVWYLPEQEKLAKFSLKLLYRMMYPTQIDQDKVGAMVGAAVTNFVDQSAPGLKKVEDTAIELAVDIIPGLSKLLGSDTPPKNAEGNNPTGKIAAMTGGAAGGISNVTTTINNFLGKNTTINPLPVRVCIGHHIDLEPLVIKGVKTTFSKETFISEINGRHLPLFATTTIEFAYWLTPTPNMEFANILGEEIFGDEMTTFK